MQKISFRELDPILLQPPDMIRHYSNFQNKINFLFDNSIIKDDH